MATPKRIAVRTAKQMVEILEAVGLLVAEVAELKAEVAELKSALVKPASPSRRSTKK